MSEWAGPLVLVQHRQFARDRKACLGRVKTVPTWAIGKTPCYSYAEALRVYTLLVIPLRATRAAICRRPDFIFNHAREVMMSN